MINGKSVLAITLARGGSKGITKKNICEVRGKPLLLYTTDEVKKSKYIDRYIVSTEDQDITKVCRENDVEVHVRPKYLSEDTTRSSDAIIDAVNKNSGYDYIVEIMCTNPLKTVCDIDGCIEKLDNTGADSVVSVVRLYDHHPSRIKYIENDRLIDFYPEVAESRRQDLYPPAYVRNGSVYATTKESLLESRMRLGKDTRPYVMKEENTINIDEKIDLYIAERMIYERDSK